MSTIFAEKINFLMVNQQTDIEEAKKRKQNFVKKKYLVIHEILVVQMPRMS